MRFDSRSAPGRLGSILGECLAERLTEAEKLLATVAQRSAEERVSYLVLQLTNRLRKRNVVRDERYFFPLRQQDMGDALGLTAVHISRVVYELPDTRLDESSGRNAGDCQSRGA
jgi:CRP-like cAMP-binding protein